MIPLLLFDLNSLLNIGLSLTLAILNEVKDLDSSPPAQNDTSLVTLARNTQFNRICSIARATPSRYRANRSRDSFTASRAICSFSPVAYSSKNGKNISLCSSSACECATKFGMSRQGIPISSVHRLPIRVEWPPPISRSNRSSLVHSVTVSADNPSIQLLAWVSQAQA